jgi:hypothetical protein
VAVIDKECRFDLARDRLPAVKEEHLHGTVVAHLPSGVNQMGAKRSRWTDECREARAAP